MFTQPVITPSMTSALASMRRSSTPPSLWIRRVANEIWPPPLTRSSTALCSAFSSSGMISGGRPTASSAVHPNSRSAAGFHSSTLRSAPNAMIASAADSMTARAVASSRSPPPAQGTLSARARAAARPRLPVTANLSPTTSCSHRRAAPGQRRRDDALMTALPGPHGRGGGGGSASASCAHQPRAAHQARGSPDLAKYPEYVPPDDGLDIGVCIAVLDQPADDIAEILRRVLQPRHVGHLVERGSGERMHPELGGELTVEADMIAVQGVRPEGDVLDPEEIGAVGEMVHDRLDRVQRVGRRQRRVRRGLDTDDAAAAGAGDQHVVRLHPRRRPY